MRRGLLPSILAKITLVMGGTVFGFLLHASLPGRPRDPELVIRLRELHDGLGALTQKVQAQSAQLEVLRGAPPPISAGQTRPIDLKSLHADLNRWVQEALEERRDPVRPPAPPTEENERARAEAEEVVVSARSAGRWTAEDARRFRELLPRMADGQRDALIGRLTVALNTGQLEVETLGAPF